MFGQVNDAGMVARITITQHICHLDEQDKDRRWMMTLLLDNALVITTLRHVQITEM